MQNFRTAWIFLIFKIFNLFLLSTNSFGLHKQRPLKMSLPFFGLAQCQSIAKKNDNVIQSIVIVYIVD